MKNYDLQVIPLNMSHHALPNMFSQDDARLLSYITQAVCVYARRDWAYPVPLPRLALASHYSIDLEQYHAYA